MKKIAFAYYGGKIGMCDKIVDIIPDHDHYVEAFSGSFAVGLNKPKSRIETLNDLNGDIVNFFRVLRDHPMELIQLLQLTPYSRAEFEQAWLPISECPIERARCFFVRVNMDISKAGKKNNKSWSKNLKFVINNFSYAPFNFYTKVNGLLDISNRIRNIQIENRPAIDLISKLDSKETVFYLDPPYLPSVRKSSNDYLFEMNQAGHVILADKLKSIKGKVILSGYESELYKSLYSDFYKIKFDAKMVPMSRGKGRVTSEMIWLNYDPLLECKKQYSLF